MDVLLDAKSYFTKDEFNCKCGVGQSCGVLDPDLVLMLNQARMLAKVPFVINSAVRCEGHNKDVGGSKDSSHLIGMAVDIRVRDSRTRFLVLEALILVGFKRIGIRKDFIHVDIDPAKDQEVTWIY